MTADPIDALLADCLAQPEEVWSTKVEEGCLAHPECASELRRRFESMMALGLIDPQSSGSLRRLGKYRIVRKLGGGSMGVVYEAVDTEFGREVALKVIRPEQMPFRSARERFRREMVAASRIVHPNVCPIYEAGEKDGIPFLAMQYVPGRSLADWIAEERVRSTSGDRLAPELKRKRIDTLCDWFADLGDGLHAAHQASVVHRDIKPANILIPDDGSPLLTDFGLARGTGDALGLSAMTAPGTIVGTPAYLAPEQIAEDGVAGPATDVYALGLTLRECLLGRPAFAAASREALYHQILAGELPEPRKEDKSIPEDLSLVVAAATTRDPAERFASAKEFANELRRIRRFEPIVIKRASMLHRARRWFQRHPVVSSTMTASILGMIVALVLLVQAIQSARQSRALNLIHEATEILREQPGVALDRAAEALALGSDQPLVLARSQEILHGLRYFETLPVQEGGRLEFAHWSPNHEFIVAGGQNADTAIFRADGTLVARIPETSSRSQSPSIAFWRDHVVLPGQDGTLRIHLLDTGEERDRLQAPSDSRQAWSLSASDRTILAVHPQSSGSPFVTRTRLWIREESRFRVVELPSQSTWGVATHLPDGRLLAAGCVWSPLGRKVQLLPSIAQKRAYWISCGETHAVITSHDPPGGAPRRVDIFALGDELKSTGSRRFALPIHRAIVSPNGRLVAVPFESGSVHLLGLGGATVDGWRTLNAGRVAALTFSNDSRTVISGNWAGAIQVFGRTGNELLRLPAHSGGVTWTEFARDDSGRLLSAAWDGTARIWDIDRFPSKQYRGFGGGLAVSPDGRRVAVSKKDGTVWLCDLDGKVVDKCRVPGWLSVSFQKNEEVLIGDVYSGRVWSWRPGSGEPSELCKTTSLARTAPRRLHDGRLLVRLGSRKLMIRDSQAGWSPLVKSGNSYTHAAVSTNGRLVAASCWQDRVEVIDLDGNIRHAFETTGIMHGLRFSPDDRLLAASSSDTVAHVWDLQTRREKRFEGHRNGVGDVAISPDATKLATGSADGMLRVFDIDSRRLLIQIHAHSRRISKVFFLARDRIVTAGSDGFVRWWMLDPDDVRAEVERLRDR